MTLAATDGALWICGSREHSGKVGTLFQWLHALAELIGTILPEMERLGVATGAEVGIETLSDRLYRAVVAGGGAVVGRSEISAWTRTQV